MRTIRISMLCLCFFALTQLVWSQSKINSQGILGRLDPRTGAFTPLTVEPAVDVDPDAASVFTGKIVATITITISSTIPTTDRIDCSVSAGVADTSTFRNYSEAETIVATRSGSKATCSITIPYAWTLGSQSSDSVTQSIEVDAISTGSTGIIDRTSVQSLPPAKVPANGGTLTDTVAVTI